MKKSVSAFAPASIGNLSVGFDLLGLAVQSNDMRLGDVVTIEENDQFEFHVIGDFAHVLPDNDKDNLVLKAYKLFTEKVPVAANENIKITLEKNLPICSGLGSSASSVVATLVALDSYFACSGCSALLLELMGKCEAGASGSLHYDNIAPSYLGGLQLCSVNSPVTHELPWPKDWKLILAYQDIDIPTAMARNILPESYTKQTTIQQMQYVAKFVHALHASDQQLAADSIIDVLAEPYRAELLPNFNSVKSALLNEYGAKAVGISGSGPTMFAIVDADSNISGALTYLTDNYVKPNDTDRKKGFATLADVNHKGAKIL